MKIVSTQVSPIFQAYTEQLRTEYARAGRQSHIRQAPSRGFETVTLSREARALAAQQADGQDESNKEKIEGEEEQERSLGEIEKDEPEVGPKEEPSEQTRQSS
ncbi:MAG: hypothetical protein MUC50_09565 [Myxococcota bacterium]|jgi:hypothetical protein|nr:hypothetical protein [Myxococcota bacterium]